MLKYKEAKAMWRRGRRDTKQKKTQPITAYFKIIGRYRPMNVGGI